VQDLKIGSASSYHRAVNCSLRRNIAPAAPQSHADSILGSLAFLKTQILPGKLWIITLHWHKSQRAIPKKKAKQRNQSGEVFKREAVDQRKLPG
jgi:hypothetical protein